MGKIMLNGVNYSAPSSESLGKVYSLDLWKTDLTNIKSFDDLIKPGVYYIDKIGRLDNYPNDDKFLDITQPDSSAKLIVENYNSSNVDPIPMVRQTLIHEYGDVLTREGYIIDTETSEWHWTYWRCAITTETLSYYVREYVGNAMYKTLGLVKTTSTVTSNSGYTACPIISGVPYYKDTVIFGKSGSEAKAGLVPAPPTTAGTTKYLREDGTWVIPPDTIYSVMKGATSSTSGTSGLVPIPGTSECNFFLRGDGTWAAPTNTVYTHPTTSGNKHIPVGGSSGQILRWAADGTAVWGADNNTTYSVATQYMDGLLSASDKKKLDGIASGANAYTLPTATSSTLGGVKVTNSSTITNSDGLALAASEKNASVNGSLANQISSVKTTVDNIISGVQVITSSKIGLNVHTSNIIRSTSGGIHLAASANNYNVYLGGAATYVMDYESQNYMPIYASTFSQQSSRKYKKNISIMTDEEGLKTLQLTPVKYNYINKNDVDCYGFIAEDVEKIITSPVTYINGQIEGLDYSKFVPYLTKMIQIQQKEINELKETISTLM